MKIARNVYGFFHCACDNDVMKDGFYPCDEWGEEVIPTSKEWDGRWACVRCGRIIKEATLEVVGVRPQNTLTMRERQEMLYG